MALRALRCDGRVPRKSRYSRSGKPPLPDQCSRGRDRGFPEERSGLFSHPSSLTGSRQGNAGKNVRDNGSPRGSPRAPTNVRGGATGGFQRSNWDAPAGIMGRAVQKCPDARRPKSRTASRTLSYVERSGMRATQQTPFQQPVDCQSLFSSKNEYSVRRIDSSRLTFGSQPSRRRAFSMLGLRV